MPAAAMSAIRDLELAADEAALWFLGQSGFVVKAAGVLVAIDPYLSDSVAAVVPELTRRFPPPLAPADLQVDIYIATHDHLDHLDPDTLGPYQFKASTQFVAPRLAARHLAALGVPWDNLTVIDSGVTADVTGVRCTGVYAAPNEPAVIDTAGYLLQFANGRSVYHSSDTACTDLLVAAAPRAEVALLCINGKGGNMNVEQAARLAAALQPRAAIGHHYDLMTHNSENPHTLGYHLRHLDRAIAAPVLEPLQPWRWTAAGPAGAPAQPGR